MGPLKDSYSVDVPLIPAAFGHDLLNIFNFLKLCYENGDRRIEKARKLPLPRLCVGYNSAVSRLAGDPRILVNANRLDLGGASRRFVDLDACTA